MTLISLNVLTFQILRMMDTCKTTGETITMATTVEAEEDSSLEAVDIREEDMVVVDMVVEDTKIETKVDGVTTEVVRVEEATEVAEIKVVGVITEEMITETTETTTTTMVVMEEEVAGEIETEVEEDMTKATMDKTLVPTMVDLTSDQKLKVLQEVKLQELVQLNRRARVGQAKSFT